ncbi:MAG: hypothetical protein WDM90_20285 [Ferruginibacter sp.]
MAGYVTSPALIIANTDKISFGISAFDRYSGSNNPTAFTRPLFMKMKSLLLVLKLTASVMMKQGYLNAHIDYKLRSSGGPFVQTPVEVAGLYQ